MRDFRDMALDRFDVEKHSLSLSICSKSRSVGVFSDMGDHLVVNG